ncbi:hypothetical protein [Thalassiella azotivora]
MLLVVVGDREAAEAVRDHLLAEGVPAEVHREALAGDDDAEDAQWVVALAAEPTRREHLERLADEHDGWVEEA